MNYYRMRTTVGTMISHTESSETKLKLFGNLGYTSGYTWLKTKRHPKAKGGYMPRVPVFFTSRVNKELSFEARKVYKQRWVEGFNEYIKDNKLELPLMTWE